MFKGTRTPVAIVFDNLEDGMTLARDCLAGNLTVGYHFEEVSWKEVIRKLKAAGFVEKRSGKGSHMLFVNPATGKEVWVTVHGHDAGKLGSRILRDAGVV